MVDNKTNFFEIIDNFKKTVDFKSIPIIVSDKSLIPKITIGIPTYKRTELLKEAIDSSLNQIEFDDYDILIVDNNSERNCSTEKLLKNYNNSKINYYKNSRNLLMAGNWNRIFELAKGEFVVLLHDDDILLPWFLKSCFPFLLSQREIGILKPTSIESTKPKINIHEISEDENLGTLKRIYDVDNYSDFLIGAPTGCIFRKKSVINIGGFNQNFFPSIDYCFMILFSNHYKIYLLNKVLTIYRIEENDSLKIEIIKGFLHVDFYLKKQIMLKYKIPNIFIKKELEKINSRLLRSHKKRLDSLKINTIELVDTYRNNIITNIISFLIKFYLKIIVKNYLRLFS